MQLSNNQLLVLTLLSTGGSIRYHLSPGASSRTGGYFLEKKGDHRDLDARTIHALETRGYLADDDGALVITDAGRKALAKLKGKT